MNTNKLTTKDTKGIQIKYNYETGLRFASYSGQIKANKHEVKMVKDFKPRRTPQLNSLRI
jgi:hypothetical protein